MANDSVETWCLYQAEGADRPRLHLPDLDLAQAMVANIQNSTWWRDNVTIEVNGNDEDAPAG